MSGFVTSVPNINLLTFRDAIREISPKWLKHGLAEKILYSIGIHLDVLGDAAVNGVRKRFPTFYDSIDALALTGHDRKIARGANELDISYAHRLLPWLDDHRTRGGPYAMLRQLLGFWAATPFIIDLVYESGKRFHMLTDGTITESIGAAWDTDTSRWARWWLVFDWPGPLNPDGLWSSPGGWDDGGVWDSDLSSLDADNIRTVPREWNAAHPLGYVTLRNGGSELWDIPAGLWSDPGNWDDGGGLPVTIAVG